MDAARLLCVLSHSDHTQPLHHQLWILAIFLLAHIAFLPGEALLRLWKVLTRVLIFTAIVLLPSILLRGFQNSGIFLGRTGILVLNLSLFLATTTSVQLVEALRQLHFPKTMIQTIELAMKYTYILGKHLQQQIECVQLRTIGQKVNLGCLDRSWTLVFIIEKPYERSLRGHDASRLRNGRQNQNPFLLEERGRVIIT